jgi:hypothetical protein
MASSRLQEPVSSTESGILKRLFQRVLLGIANRLAQGSMAAVSHNALDMPAKIFNGGLLNSQNSTASIIPKISSVFAHAHSSGVESASPEGMGNVNQAPTASQSLIPYEHSYSAFVDQMLHQYTSTLPLMFFNQKGMDGVNSSLIINRATLVMMGSMDSIGTGVGNFRA